MRLQYAAKLVPVAVTLLAISITSSTDAAAQRATTQDATTTLQVYSRLTVVDVTATDSNGQPVYGLQQSNFKIFEDGKPQAIRNFEEVGLRPTMPPPEMPPNVYTNLQPPPPSSALNIILLDLANEAPVDDTSAQQVAISTSMQHYVKQAAIQAVQNMPTGTQVAILSMTNNLRIVQSFTADRALLTAAIDAVPYDLLGMATGSRGSCFQANIRNESVLESLDRIAVDSIAIHGRKNLIWFTTGVPAIADPGMDASCLPDYQNTLSNTYALLTAAQVSIYPIDATGVGLMGRAQLAEQMVAEATGGIAYTNNNDMASSVLKSISDGANYYSIAYIPPSQKHNGIYHKINVKTDLPGVHLNFRTGYFDDDLAKVKMPPGLNISITPPPAPSGNMKAPMSRGMPVSQQLLFDVGVEPSTLPRKPGGPPVLGTLLPSLRSKHLTRYAFSYMLPLQQITFAKASNGIRNGSLDFDIAVYDSNDKLLTGLSQVVKTTLSNATYHQQIADKQPIRFTQQIDLPPGQLFIRVGVLDHATNKTGTLELPLKVDK